jgi:hypothetical protein
MIFLIIKINARCLFGPGSTWASRPKLVPTPLIFLGTSPPCTVCPGIRKSRISWPQNRPIDYSSWCLEPAMNNCAPLPVVHHRKFPS